MGFQVRPLVVCLHPLARLWSQGQGQARREDHVWGAATGEGGAEGEGAEGEGAEGEGAEGEEGDGEGRGEGDLELALVGRWRSWQHVPS